MRWRLAPDAGGVGPGRHGVISTVAAVGLAIAVVACSGDDGTDSSAGDDPGSIATDAPTTEPSTDATGGAASTSTLPNTTLPASTSPSTTTPPTTAIPSTEPPATDPPATDPSSEGESGDSQPDLDALEAEIAAAYDVIYEGYWACLRAPLECDTSWLVPGSGSAEAMQATMQGLADRDRFVGDDDVGYYVIEEIEIGDSRTEATVRSCWWSTAVLYTTPVDPTRPAGPDNPPTVVNDIPGSYRQEDTLTRVDGVWMVAGSRGIEEVAREDLCVGSLG